MVNNGAPAKRIHFLDELRGLAVFCMVFYHAFFIIGSMFGVGWAYKLFDFFEPVQPLFAGIFIALCGISCSLSRNNLKRGLRLLAVAAGFTFVTALILPLMGIEGCEIYFGILHFLSIAIILCALLSKPLGRLSPAAGMLICAVLYPFTSGIEDGVLGYGELISLQLPSALYTTNILMPFGIYSPSFYSGDYFPIFPNIFIFLFGFFIGRHCVMNSFPESLYKQRSRFLGFLGRRALIIYIVHMPLIYLAAYIIIKMIGVMVS